MTEEIKFEIKLDLSKCTGCGTCNDECPMGVYEIIQVGRKKQSRVQNPDWCIGCHTCEFRCPYEAVVVLPPLGEELKLKP